MGRKYFKASAGWVTDFWGWVLVGRFVDVRYTFDLRRGLEPSADATSYRLSKNKERIGQRVKMLDRHELKLASERPSLKLIFLHALLHRA